MIDVTILNTLLTVGGGAVVINTLRDVGTQAAATYGQTELLKQSLGQLAGVELLKRGVVDDLNAARSVMAAWGDDLYEWSRATAIMSPFESDVITETLRAAASFGFAATEYQSVADAMERGEISAQRLTTALLNTGTALGLPGYEVSELAKIFGKIQGAGTMTAEDTDMFVDRGVNALDILADHLGVSTRQIIRLRSEGKLTSDLLLPLLEELERRYGGAAEAAGDTWTGLTASLADLKNYGFSDLMTPAIEDVLKPRLDDLVEYLGSDEVQATIADLGVGLRDNFEHAAEATEHIVALLSRPEVQALVGTGADVGSGLLAGLPQAALGARVAADYYANNEPQGPGSMHDVRALQGMVAGVVNSGFIQGVEDGMRRTRLGAELLQMRDAVRVLVSADIVPSPDLGEAVSSAFRNSILAVAEQEIADRANDALSKQSALFAWGGGITESAMSAAIPPKSRPKSMPITELIDRNADSYGDLVAAERGYLEDMRDLREDHAGKIEQLESDLREKLDSAANDFYAESERIEEQRRQDEERAAADHADNLERIKDDYYDSLRQSADDAAQAGESAFGDLVGGDVSFYRGSEDRLEDWNKKRELLHKQGAACKVDEERKAFEEAEAQAAEGYARQAALEEQALGESLIRYAQANALRAGLSQDAIAQMTTALSAEFGLTASASDIAFGKIRQAIDGWVAAGGAGTAQVVGQFGHYRQQARDLALEQEQIAESLIDNLVAQRLDGAISESEYQAALSQVYADAAAQAGMPLAQGPTDVLDLETQYYADIETAEQTHQDALAAIRQTALDDSEAALATYQDNITNLRETWFPTELEAIQEDLDAQRLAIEESYADARIAASKELDGLSESQRTTLQNLAISEAQWQFRTDNKTQQELEALLDSDLTGAAWYARRNAIISEASAAAQRIADSRSDPAVPPGGVYAVPSVPTAPGTIQITVPVTLQVDGEKLHSESFVLQVVEGQYSDAVSAGGTERTR